MNNVGICRLCLNEKVLLKKSHILPKFILNKVLNKHKEGFVVMGIDTSNQKKVFDNAYEPNILCNYCDNKILGGYEDYGSKFLFGPLGKKDIISHENFQTYIDVKNVDYQKLKMFILSILWRSSISKIFNEVKLSERQEEELRQILLSNQAISQNFYPVFIWNYAHLKEIPNEIILPPYIGKKKAGEQNFLFIGGGMIFQILIEFDKMSEIYKEAILKEAGDIKIIHIQYESMKKLMNKYLNWNFIK